jgi:hypothetical protein
MTSRLTGAGRLKVRKLLAEAEVVSFLKEQYNTHTFRGDKGQRGKPLS